jgi:hypothetical integral membrane protein (TIGR02206 family)
MDILQYLSGNYHGAPFVLFGTAHIVTLIIVALFVFGLTLFKGASGQLRKRVRWTMGIVLILNEIAFHIWNIAIGTWTIQTMLPLQLCNVLVWLGAYMLFTKNYTIYEFIYLLGITGPLQAILTPDAGPYGFPHFRYFQPFISHGLLVAAGVYMTVVEGYRPTWKSLLRVFVITNLYVIFIYFVNSAIGSNYLMINYKPDVPSLLTLLPPWPWYIAWMEGIAVALVLLLYLPFFMKDWREKRAANIGSLK